ncbi:MAG: phosphoglucomutase/phosphomannomutase family protein [Candidatus Sericytochromatia bacterium]|uniref:phosphoglucomutase (alpha-D-glucose-1,6-bisphosphate-dependent) n=1 Tax=Candidatus Tanganyikabacteria bacterium TaxID=2961651 RepID=A0A937X5T9_9BACT|nr:phosphoglucomutase/phosphomannomutase family protein [Candidatus Tanganyikabacteria bacterium]
MLSRSVATTPNYSWAVKQQGAQAGFVITASHNPAEYSGFKVKAAFGGSAPSSDTDDIERRLGPSEAVRREGGGQIETFDPRPPYLDQLRGLVDVESMRNRLAPRRGVTTGLRWPDLFVVIDAMHGAGAGYFSELFGYPRPQTDLSPPQFMAEARTARDPLFGGVNPEPIAPHLGSLVDVVKREAARYPMSMGLAFDGDADRIGAVDSSGVFINSHQILALILRHLVETKGWSGGVVKTFSTSRLVEKLASSYELPVHEVPIGFKYICELILREDILIGGEESGGIGIKNHIPERDGLLCALLLMEIALTRGKGLAAQIAELHERFGPHHYDRIDLNLRDRTAMTDLLTKLEATPPRDVDGVRVTDVQTLDGVKLVFEDGAWLLFRGSGTEPVLRIYAEAPDPEEVKRLLRFGRELAKDAGRPIGS